MRIEPLKTDHDGLPIGFDLTGGEASDSTHFETLMEIGPECNRRRNTRPR
jgi:hypothetical protein